MEERYMKLIFESAKVGNWEHVETELLEHAKSFADISRQNEHDNNRNLLHYACGTDDPTRAEIAVKMLFERISKLGYGFDERLNFVNSTNSRNRTPLYMALERGLYNIIKILLEYGAEVSINFDSRFNNKYHEVLQSVFDRCLVIQQDDCDKFDESLWVISCDFSVITGERSQQTDIKGSNVKSEEPKSSLEHENIAQQHENVNPLNNIPETKLFAQILRLPREKRFNLLMHPLVHLFVHHKCEKYNKAKKVSIVFHVLWYLITAFFIVGTLIRLIAANPATKNISTSNKSEYGFGYITSHVAFRVVLAIIFGMMFFKEVLEILMCPSKVYHFKQMEKLGQYTIFGVIVTIVVFEMTGISVYNFYEWAQIIVAILYSLGFTASLLLIQGQFSKTVKFGVNNHMMIKGFKKLLRFILPFSPMFVGFGAYFKAVLPNNPSFSTIPMVPKTLTMQTGEINFDEVFSETNTKGGYFFIIPTAIVVGVFILLMVTLFPVLLIGLTIDNIKDLKDEAIAAHAASCLEIANIQESCWVKFQEGCINPLISFFKTETNTNDIEMTAEVAASKRKPVKNEGLPKTFTYTNYFEEIPDDIKELIYKNLNKYIISNSANEEPGLPNTFHPTQTPQI